MEKTRNYKDFGMEISSSCHLFKMIFQDAEKTKNRIEADNKTLQEKLDREAKALKEKMSEENEKRMNEAKALQVRFYKKRTQ